MAKLRAGADPRAGWALEKGLVQGIRLRSRKQRSTERETRRARAILTMVWMVRVW